MRYRYQVHEINVPIPPGEAILTDEDLEAVYARFDRLYEAAYGKGSAYRAAGKEIVTLRVTGSGALPKPALRPLEGGGPGVGGPKGHAAGLLFRNSANSCPLPCMMSPGCGRAWSSPSRASSRRPSRRF